LDKTHIILIIIIIALLFNFVYFKIKLRQLIFVLEIYAYQIKIISSHNLKLLDRILFLESENKKIKNQLDDLKNKNRII
jgi:hypothetical protein